MKLFSKIELRLIYKKNIQESFFRELQHKACEKRSWRFAIEEPILEPKQYFENKVCLTDWRTGIGDQSSKQNMPLISMHRTYAIRMNPVEFIDKIKAKSFAQAIE